MKSEPKGAIGLLTNLLDLKKGNNPLTIHLKDNPNSLPQGNQQVGQAQVILNI